MKDVFEAQAIRAMLPNPVKPQERLRPSETVHHMWAQGGQHVPRLAVFKDLTLTLLALPLAPTLILILIPSLTRLQGPVRGGLGRG